MGGGQNININRTLEEVTADVVELTKELELEVEAEDVTDSLQSHWQTLNGWGVVSYDEQIKYFIEKKTTPSEVVVKGVETTTKDLKWYINSVDKAAAGFRGLTSNMKVVLLKWFWTVLCSPETLLVKGKVLMQGTSLLP